MKVNKDFSFYFIYAIVSFIVVLSTGDAQKYIFTLDFPAGPTIYKSFFSSLYGFEVPIWGGHLIWKLAYSFLALAFSAPVMQKILLVFILFMSGYSGYQTAPVDSRKAKFFAGLLYMLNPYTYIRIVVGHWSILFAYALLPLALRSFIVLLEKKEFRELIKFVLLLTLVSVNSHTLAMALIALCIIFVFHFMQSREPADLKIVAFAGALFVLLNAFWLIPFATAKDTLITGIGNEDITAFAPRIETFSALFTIASMHGFWRDGYLYAKDFIPYWQVLFVFILFLSVQGFMSGYRDGKIGNCVKAFALIAVSGLVLAAGINSPLSDIFQWLFDHTLLKGMRDSHKFVTLLALSYSYLGAIGVSEFERMASGDITRHKKTFFRAVIILSLLAPVIYSITFFNGFAGQIRSGDFPDDWYEVNAFLNNDGGEFRVLFLPWHQYMNFKWVPNRDKRIANPAQNFFDRDVITGKNVEISGIYRQVYSPEQVYVDFLLDNRGKITNFGELISLLDVKYILLAREADHRNYLFLFNQSDIVLVKETGNFYVFMNIRKVGKIYSANNLTLIKDWNELIDRSGSEDILQNIYLIGNNSGRADIVMGEDVSEKMPAYEKKSAIEYQLKGNVSGRYLVFTEPYSENWELNGREPFAAYGVVNAYETGDASVKEIGFARFKDVLFPSYLLSLIVLTVLIAAYFRPSRS